MMDHFSEEVLAELALLEHTAMGLEQDEPSEEKIHQWQATF